MKTPKVENCKKHMRKLPFYLQSKKKHHAKHPKTKINRKNIKKHEETLVGIALAQ